MLVGKYWEEKQNQDKIFDWISEIEIQSKSSLKETFPGIYIIDLLIYYL